MNILFVALGVYSRLGGIERFNPKFHFASETILLS